jgi:two-component system, OmpR family, sensor histidine kinase SenX3
MKSTSATFDDGFQDSISEEVAELLNVVDIASIILNASERPIFYSNMASVLGVVRDEKVVADNLLALIRVVRRSGKVQSGVIEIPLGPIGEGFRRFSVKVTPLGDAGLILALLNDESEAERIDAVRRDFVANISHELKTPIGALSLLTEAVLEGREDPEAVQNFASRMRSEVTRLSDLVQEIINLSRLQDADPLLDAITVDIDEVVDQAITHCSYLAEGRDIELVRGPRCAASVIGDRNQLIMAIHNLVENAINYSPAKTKVTVSTSHHDNIVDIEVVDQGIGISDNDIDRVFERFYRVDPARSRATGGTGLGLSIVKHVARNHGGEVNVWSSIGVGSTFVFRLPTGEDSIEEVEK